MMEVEEAPCEVYCHLYKKLLFSGLLDERLYEMVMQDSWREAKLA